jgi:hypothetical protein
MIESVQYDKNGAIVAVIDGKKLFIPDKPGNRHRQMIAEWEAQGNTITPYTPPPPTIEDYYIAIQKHIDSVAQQKNYANALSIASYVTSTNSVWKGEAEAFIAWRDAVWQYAYQELAKVQGGQRQQPTVEGFVTELPLIVWPA